MIVTTEVVDDKRMAHFHARIENIRRSSAECKSGYNKWVSDEVDTNQGLVQKKFIIHGRTKARVIKPIKV